MDHIQLIISGLFSVLVVVVSAILSRRKDKVDIFDKVRDSLSKEIERLESKIEKNISQIQQMERDKKLDREKIVVLQRDNELCKYKHEVAKLEMTQLRKLSFLHKTQFDKVFVLDDDEDVLEEFHEKFHKISVLHYEGFHNVDKFLKKAQSERPIVVVLDYKLGAITADDVIRELGYQPEIFIISSEMGFQARFAGKNIRFFVKETDYVFKIAIAIIKHLNDKS